MRTWCLGAVGPLPFEENCASALAALAIEAFDAGEQVYQVSLRSGVVMHAVNWKSCDDKRLRVAT